MKRCTACHRTFHRANIVKCTWCQAPLCNARIVLDDGIVPDPDALQAQVKELERERDEARAEALRILRLCADRPNLDHIPFQPAPVEDWFNRIDNAGSEDLT